MPIPQYLDVSLLLLVVAAAVNDLATRKIPNRLLLAGLACALALHLLSAAPAAGVLNGLAGVAIGLLVFLPLYLLRGMAAGDVKLMAAVGAFLGPAGVFHAALLAACTGGVMAVVIIIGKGRVRATLANLRIVLRPMLMRATGMQAVEEPLEGGSVGSMPYGLAIAVGTLIVIAGH